MFIKKNYKTKSWGGSGRDLKGALGIKLTGSESGTDEKKLPWVLIGSAKNGMFYLTGWRVTDWKGPKVVKKGYNSWVAWFGSKTFTENEDNVGPDVWCDEAFEAYRRLLVQGLGIVIHNKKPIFTKKAGSEKIFVNKSSGESLINFGKTNCNYSQGFAWLASNSAIVGNFVTQQRQESVARKYNLGEWRNLRGVKLGELEGLLMDRIDRISINEEGIKDSRGNFVKWNPKYNPIIKIHY